MPDRAYMARPPSEVLRDTGTLFVQVARWESQLRLMEFRQKLLQSVAPAVWIFTAGILSILAAGLFLVSLSYGLSVILPAWIATLLVGVFTVLFGIVLFALGLNEKSQNPMPRQGSSGRPPR